MVSEVNKYILSVLGIAGFLYAVPFFAGINLYLAGFLLLIAIIFGIGYVSIQFYKGVQESTS